MRRKSAFQYAYDWVNTCELTQLDAIMLAFLVFCLGLLVLTTLFVVGHVQSYLAYQQIRNAHLSVRPENIPVWTATYGMPQAAAPSQSAQPDAPGTLFASVAPVSLTDVQARFGNPRAGKDSAFAYQQSGQAQASASPTY